MRLSLTAELRVERSDWKGNLEQGSEYEAAFSNIAVDDSVLLRSRGSTCS